jgi:hypothetical protein
VGTDAGGVCCWLMLNSEEKPGKGPLRVVLYYLEHTPSALDATVTIVYRTSTGQ